MQATLHSSNWGGTLEQWAAVRCPAVVGAGHQSWAIEQTITI